MFCPSKILCFVLQKSDVLSFKNLMFCPSKILRFVLQKSHVLWLCPSKILRFVLQKSYVLSFKNLTFCPSKLISCFVTLSFTNLTFCYMCWRLPQTDTNTVFNPAPLGNLTPLLTKLTSFKLAYSQTFYSLWTNLDTTIRMSSEKIPPWSGPHTTWAIAFINTIRYDHATIYWTYCTDAFSSRYESDE
jgi:hypothetical protein